MEIGFALVWLGAYAAVAALAYPITAVLFARFPGKGAGFALPLGLATLAMTSYYVGRFAFGYESLVAGLLLLGLASALALRRGVDLDRRAYAEAMAVFGVAFFLFVVLRALDPAVHPGGGEKFLDFGLLNSLWRAETVPPEDMWFAGEPMAYYYGGHMVAVLLAKATFTPPKYAYNLALPGFYALLVTGVYTLAGAIADERGASRFSAAALAAMFVGLASNLATPLRLLAWLGSGIVPGLESFVRSLGVEVAGLAGGPERFSYWTASRVIDGTANEFPFFAYLNGDMHAHMMSKGFLLLVAGLLFSYWQMPSGERRRRWAILLVCLPLLAGLLAITNTWSYPTVGGLTLLTVMFAPSRPLSLLPPVVFEPGRLLHFVASTLQRRLPAGLSNLVVPFLVERSSTAGSPGAAVSSDEGADRTEDDEPPSTARQREVDLPFEFREEVERVFGGALIAVAVGGLGFLLVAPFFATSTTDRSVALVEQHSGLWELLVVHGGFLAVTVPYLARYAKPDRLDRMRVVQLLFVVGLLAGTLATISGLPVAIVLFGPPLVVAWILLRTDRAVSFETVLVVGVLGLVLLVEFVYITRAGRFNTVFKFYSQVWALWGIAVGVMLASHADPIASAKAVIRRLSGRTGVEARDPSTTPDGGLEASSGRPGRGEAAGRSDELDGLLTPGHVGGLLALVLLSSLLVYPGLAVAEHLELSSGPATLDATRFVEEDHRTEAEAIAWVRDRDGQPNIASIPTRCMYRWSNDAAIERYAGEGPTPHTTRCQDYKVVGGSAAASLTGVPTVAGWHHEVGYRGREPFLERVRDVRTIYNGTPEQRVSALRKHDVDVLDVVNGIEPAYSDENVTIYRVDHDRLEAADRRQASTAGEDRRQSRASRPLPDGRPAWQ
jgi:YYY domain-containing protein